MSCIIAAAFIVAGAAAAGVVVEVAAVAVAFLLSPGHPAPDKVAGISCCGRRPPGGEGRPVPSARLVHPPLRALKKEGGNGLCNETHLSSIYCEDTHCFSSGTGRNREPAPPTSPGAKSDSQGHSRNARKKHLKLIMTCADGAQVL